ncbi:hypothetical protein FA592_02200 [Sulfurospirillum diekertiae]|jgi:hypothetical protein|uniref:Lipoprotein n=1 Tax=Sulfurospirillum diekertiae TaxID=1854492 RepID=A0A290HQQ8_9BACT|nr:hypothetical protein [Sulfurospirillum diekertiae]ATB70038.1 hypothetical protein SJPD1_1933 [Sulfurospirillum diekertiae]QIR75091.1 hypothetical protein FA584_02210 [Sulfurospirillum diekertiae]QIR77755.1 hypothetical protein FA592_02200 [Sulfurospirillum diekertiae]
MRTLITTILLFATFLLSGCAPKEVNLATINPVFKPMPDQIIAVYNPDQDTIIFHEFSLKNAILVEQTWGKVLPFRVEFMDLWVTGLGHDLRRLTNGNAETIKDALMYNAGLQGMQTLHVNEKDYIINYEFARDMVTAIDRYEEKVKRYERDREFPFLLRR